MHTVLTNALQRHAEDKATALAVIAALRRVIMVAMESPPGERHNFPDDILLAPPVTALAAVLDAHPADADVAARVLRALATLCVSNAFYKQLPLDLLSNIGPVVMRRFPDSLPVLSHALPCRLLRTAYMCGKPWALEHLRSRGAIEALLNLCVRHKASLPEHEQLRTLSSLKSIVCNSPAASFRRMHDAGGDAVPGAFFGISLK